jgi:hypothetical protein
LEYLKQYKKVLNTANIIDAGSVFVPSKITSFTFKDLTHKDKSLFYNLRKVTIPNGISGYSLNELFFELGHFIDDYLIRKIEFHIIERRELEDWGIKPDPTGCSKLKPLWKNKGMWVQNSAMEEYIWRKTSDFTAKDEENFFTLFGKFRNKSYKDTIYWKMDYSSYKELMEEAKGSDFKLRFLRQWYKKKLAENEMKFNIPYGIPASSDKKIFQHTIGVLWKKIGNEFEKVFGQKIEEIDSKSIKKVLNTLIQRIVINNDPLNLDFIKVVFFHPALKDRDWEELYAIINNQNIPIYDEPFMFSTPIPVRGDKLQVEISKEEWVSRIENASVNFLPGLINKILT